jgi:hypothetical protein
VVNGRLRHKSVRREDGERRGGEE